MHAVSILAVQASARGPARLRLADKRAQPPWRHRHPVDLHAKWAQCILDGRADSRRSAHTPAFTASLYALFGERRWRLYVADAHVRWHLVDGWDEVIGIGRGEQLALFIVIVLLIQRSADALRSATADMAGERHRIDHRSAIMDRDVVEETQLSGPWVNFHDRHVTHVPHDRIEDAEIRTIIGGQRGQ